MCTTGLPPRPPTTAFSGRVLGPGDPEYDAARTVFNGMVDRFPQLITQPSTADDVAAAIRHGVDAGLEIAVRSGGHSRQGNSTTEGGLVIDLRRMNSISVDPVARTARVGGGATWSQLGRAAQEYGLAANASRHTPSGVAASSLSGGSGWLERQLGLTCDSLISVELVTADGRQVTASETEHPDLFWALHGGGGNFGVATAVTVRLHPIPSVASLTLLWPWSAYGEVVRTFRSVFETDPPPALSGAVVAVTDPPGTVVPAQLHGRLVTKVEAVHTGTTDELLELIDPLRKLCPATSQVRTSPSAANRLSPNGPPGLRSHWRPNYLESLSDQAIDEYAEWIAQVPDRTVARVPLLPWSGAVTAGADRWPGPFRRAPWMLGVLARWDSPTRDDRAVGWIRAMHDLPSHRALDTRFDPADGARLGRVKSAYDPGNVFRLNQNIQPA
ncbi:FAD-binding oxidoreductase [Kribbella sp. NPDC051770]|uniref:FAD-binding oxidoreductase n=1 Tax=Kribbella sp. NPDC051770 TaxID=3155413 RepID=UPI00341394D7